MDVNLVGFCQGSGGEIDIESAESDHREDVVTRHDVRGFPKEIAQPDSGVGGDFREHLLLRFGLDWRVGPDVVLQELNIPLVHPVDLTGKSGRDSRNQSFGRTLRPADSATDRPRRRDTDSGSVLRGAGVPLRFSIPPNRQRSCE